MAPIRERIKKAWNAFSAEEKNVHRRPSDTAMEFGSASYGMSSINTRRRLTYSNEASLMASIVNRIGIDIATITMQHVRVNENKQFVEELKTGLNDCLTVEANIDQAAQAFRLDLAMTLCDKGVVAVVPVDTDDDPNDTASVDIKTMRVGEITAWYPQHVKVLLYDERDGQKKEVTLRKRNVAIIENPLYSVMNEPNSTLKRLIRKLNLLDAIDEQSGSGKLDMIIQLPYVIKTEAKQQQAQQRAKDIEVQLKGSQYGIAYTDGTERITQLNRPVENKLLTQIEFLTEMLYGQLGLTKAVFDGTASEQEMLNYHNRTIEPMLQAITEAFKRAFISKTGRSQGQSVEFYRDPFKLVSMTGFAEIADKFGRNEIMSPNEIRSGMGLKPSNDPKADALKNRNMPGNPEEEPGATSSGPSLDEQDAIMEQTFGDLEKMIDDIEQSITEEV